MRSLSVLVIGVGFLALLFEKLIVTLPIYIPCSTISPGARYFWRCIGNYDLYLYGVVWVQKHLSAFVPLVGFLALLAIWYMERQRGRRTTQWWTVFGWFALFLPVATNFHYFFRWWWLRVSWAEYYETFWFGFLRSVIVPVCEAIHRINFWRLAELSEPFGSPFLYPAFAALFLLLVFGPGLPSLVTRTMPFGLVVLWSAKILLAQVIAGLFVALGLTVIGHGGPLLRPIEISMSVMLLLELLFGVLLEQILQTSLFSVALSRGSFVLPLISVALLRVALHADYSLGIPLELGKALLVFVGAVIQLFFFAHMRDIKPLILAHLIWNLTTLGARRLIALTP